MSVIHEALKRAELERRAGFVPETADSPAPPLRVHPRRRRSLVVATLGFSLILPTAAFWALWREHRPAPSAGPTTVPSAPSTTPRPPDIAGAEPSTPAGVRTPADPAVGPTAAGLNARAAAAFRAGRPEEALLLLEQALRLAPDMPEAHNNYGMVLRAQGRLAEARAAYLRALALLPTYPEAHNNLGLIWCEEGNLDEAIRSFEEALSKRPGYSSAHLNLAVVYDKRGKLAEAFYHYRRFLDCAGTDEQELVRRVQARLRG